jgi:hypothetical protein
MSARTALAAVAAVLAVQGAAPAHADPTPAPPTPYQIAGPDGPMLPGNQILPPVCAHAMRACGYTLDPVTMTWRPRGADETLADPPEPATNNLLASMARIARSLVLTVSILNFF